MSKYHEMISRQKTTIAVLRQMLGLSVTEFGKLNDKSISAITKLENGQLPLSQETALRISNETGVAMEWLMGGKPKEKPWAYDAESVDSREPYQKKLFELIQARKAQGITPGAYQPGINFIRAFNVIVDWFPIFAKADKDGRPELPAYRMRKFLEGMAADLGQDPGEFVRVNPGACVIGATGDPAWTLEQTDGGLRLVPSHGKKQRGRPTKANT